jgi:hypothetical protein
VEWTVLFDEEFAEWLDTLPENLQNKILRLITLLEHQGPNLGRPRVDGIKGSAYSNMKELRVQHKGDPWRVLFAFDTQRNAILLVGGNKAGNERWYAESIPIADQRFRRHLESLKNEGHWLMVIKARDYIAKLPVRQQETIESEGRKLLLEELSLAAIREARRQSQIELANKLGVRQPAVSKIERQTDLYLSTLKNYITAMGGELEILARFPDRDPVRITQFKPLKGRSAARPIPHKDRKPTPTPEPGTPVPIKGAPPGGSKSSSPGKRSSPPSDMGINFALGKIGKAAPTKPGTHAQNTVPTPAQKKVEKWVDPIGTTQTRGRELVTKPNSSHVVNGAKTAGELPNRGLDTAWTAELRAK